MTKIVDLQDKREERADLNPLQALKGITEEIESGQVKAPERMVVVTESGGQLEVFGSGWHGDDVMQCLGLLVAAQHSLLED